MSVVSPVRNDSALPTVTITVGGQAIDSDKIVAVETWQGVNRVPRARLVINDGDPATNRFPLGDGDKLVPGKTVTIAAGYGSASSTIFSGVIVRHAADVQVNAPARRVIDMTDTALKMTLQRKNAVFKDKSDQDVVTKLIDANGLSAGTNDAPTDPQEAIIQHHATDWDMLVTRAEANGLIVIVDAGKVSVAAPDTSGDAVLKLEYGDSVLALEAELDAASQLSTAAVKSRSWSYTKQEVAEGAATAKSVTTPGNVAFDDLAKVFGLSTVSRQTAAMLPDAALTAWSSGALLRSRLAKVCGRVRFQGSAKAVVGKMIELAGMGARFDGKAFIAGVHHRMSANRWLTTVEFGLDARGFAVEAPHIGDPGAAGQLPPVSGLQIGQVKQVAEDKAGDFRVLVSLPLFADDANGVWARLAGCYASNGVGAVFYPEVGDEVILGFMDDDPRSPVILGSVYSTKRAPAYPPNKENDKKAIVTRSKLEMTFNDKDKIVEIKTPGGHSIMLNDKTGEITIKDSNSNSMVLGKSGIAIDSASDIKMTAKANISIKAGANLAMEATANASLKAVQISEQASGKYSAKANGMAELVANGILTVQGSIVKIN
jgi:Rhs element Vgr protein